MLELGNVKIKSGLNKLCRGDLRIARYYREPEFPPTEPNRNPKNGGCVQRKTHISDIKRLVGIDLIPESVLDISNRNRFHP